jgi:hypothetical protein
MKDKNAFYRLLRCMAAAVVLTFSCLAAAQASAASLEPPIGPGNVVVHTKFGGGIFGFDIDQNGSEGVLSEAQGSVPAAVEAFDQKTGKIIKVEHVTRGLGDDITLGVVGASVGLIEHEHVSIEFVDKRIYHVLDPLSANKYTALWTPAFDQNHIIMGVSRNQGTPTSAFFVFDNSLNNPHNLVFGSNVAANTFGPLVKMTDVNFEFGIPPMIGLNTRTNTAVLAQDNGSPTSMPDIGLVNLTTGKFSQFTGVGLGFVNGMAVDSEDGIACTTTEIDGDVQFYNLKKRTGFTEPLAGSNGQFQSGADVEFDPIHKLFLIAQPNSSTGAGSSIQVYDIKGKLVESLNGFNFSNTFSVIFVHIALNPRLRSGFVDDPEGIRSFTY